MSIKDTIRKVEKDREYNLSQIRDEALFPWAKDIRTIRRIVKKDYWGENVLKALVSGEGRGIEYLIKGERIIKFLEAYGAGALIASSKK